MRSKTLNSRPQLLVTLKGSAQAERTNRPQKTDDWFFCLGRPFQGDTRVGAKRSSFLTGLFLLLIATFSSSCGDKKLAETGLPSKAAAPRSVEFLQKKLLAGLPKNVQRLSGKAKIHLEQDGETINASANLVWVRDSMLWLSLRKFGIEGARVLLRPDSVFMLNRLEKTYAARSWLGLQRDYNLPEGWPLLQAVILGTTWFEPTVDLRADTTGGLHRLAGTNGTLSADYRIEEGTFFVRQMTFLQQREARAVTIGFSEFQKIAPGGQFPYLRQLVAVSPATGKTLLEIELTDVEFNLPKTVRFEVPDHYRRD